MYIGFRLECKSMTLSNPEYVKAQRSAIVNCLVYICGDGDELLFPCHKPVHNVFSKYVMNAINNLLQCGVVFWS